ncbi:MAG TPA: MBL fold metallo-hydrolase [Kofleriaceae bacterium]|nr:MBL fold metallo-hydrolase [Kofleriaceae bacterium]
MRPWLCLILAACAHAATVPPREPLALTYLGVAGWQLEAAGKTILTDPYFSRPADADQPLVPDAAAIAAHAPARADLIVVGHSHFDHLLDAAAVAQRTGAELVGSLSTMRVAIASGVAANQLTGISGGEDLARTGFSVRVIPSLHSMLGAADALGEIVEAPQLPMPQSGYKAGGTFAYSIRIAGREVLVLDTANFIERELAGIHPDIAIIAPGLREQIRDYSCRLMHVLGDPPVVLVTHFDDWHHAPADQPPSDDTQRFVAEIQRCSPHTRVMVPKHFDRMTF